MLSDVLLDAMDDIELYQRDYSDVYEGVEQEIEEVKSAMSKLLTLLLNPFAAIQDE